MRPTWTAAAMASAAMIGKGMSGTCSDMIAFSHSGALPPGEGRISTAMPSQTKEMPSVTTIEGRLRR